MKNLTYNILLKPILVVCILVNFLPGLAQLEEGGYDFMDGYIYGEHALQFNPADFDNVFMVTNTKSFSDGNVYDPQYDGTFARALQEAEDATGSCLIRFEIQDAEGSQQINLAGEIKTYKGALESGFNCTRLVIDGKPEQCMTPKIKLYEANNAHGFKLIGFEEVIIQGIDFDFGGDLQIQGHDIILNNNTLVFHHSNGLILEAYRHFDIKNNIFGTNIYGTYLGEFKLFIYHNNNKNNDVQDSYIRGNVFSGYKNTLLSYQHDINSAAIIINHNAFYKSVLEFYEEDMSDYQNIVNQNTFVLSAEAPLDKAITYRYFFPGNTKPGMPVILSDGYDSYEAYIAGEIDIRDARVELYLSNNGSNALRYLGYAMASQPNGDKWTWRLSQSSENWADPDFSLEPGDKVIATATGPQGTSEFSGSYTITTITPPLIKIKPLCSNSPNVKRRWKLINLTEQNILCQYYIMTEDETSSIINLTLESQESQIVSSNFVNGIYNTLVVEYNENGQTRGLSSENEGLLCELTCDEFFLDFEIEHVSCPGNADGSVRLIFPDEAEVVHYQWEDPTAGPYRTDLEEGYYSVTAVILDKDLNICEYEDIVEIGTPMIIPSIIKEPSSCSGDDGSATLNSVLILPYNNSYYQCGTVEYDEPADEFACDAGLQSLTGYTDIVINAGEVKSVPADDAFFNNVTINGGTLVVCGVLHNSNITINSGGHLLVQYSGSVITESLTNNATIDNYGELEADEVENASILNNYGEAVLYGLTNTSEGAMINHSVMEVDGLVNEGFIQNYMLLNNFGDLNNQNGAEFQNYCKVYNTNDFLNSGIFINHGFAVTRNFFYNYAPGEIYLQDGAETFTMNFDNEGLLKSESAECFCFLSVNGAQMGNLTIGQQTPDCGKNIECDCNVESYLVQDPYFVDSANPSFRSKVLSPLTNGEHEVEIEINGCAFPYEFVIEGGIDYIKYPIDDPICPGGFEWIGGEVNPWTEESDPNKIPYTIWDNNNGIIDFTQNANSQKASPDVTTTYNYTVKAYDYKTDDGVTMCSLDQQVTLPVYPTIDFTLSDENVSICRGEDITITASSGQNVKYTWYTEFKDFEVTDVAQITVSPDEDTEYFVEAEHLDNGCKRVKTVHVTVLDNPVVNITADATSLCPGESTTLHASGAASYQWSPATYLSDPTASDPVTTPGDDITYLIIATASNSCTAQDIITINVFDEPTVTVSLTDECLGRDQRLEATGGTAYLWDNPDKLDNNTVANPIASIDATTTFNVTVTDDNGCQNDGSLILDPINWPDAGDDLTLCFGDETTLTAIGADDGTYQWYPEELFANSQQQTQTISLTSNRTFTVEAEKDGCTNTDEVNVIVDASCRCETESTGEYKVYLWTGATGDNLWESPGNWSYGAGIGIPGEDPSDVVYFNSDDITNYPEMTRDRTIQSICFVDGKIDMGVSTLTVTGDATFVGGIITSAPSVDDQVFGLRIDNRGGTPLSSVLFAGTTFDCRVDAYNAAEIHLNGSEFMRYAHLEQAGSTPEVRCTGENHFHDNVELINSGTTNWFFSLGYESGGDRFSGNVLFDNQGSGNIYPVTTHQSQFEGDIIVNGDITFGAYGGITQLTGGTEQIIASADGSDIMIRKLEVNKMQGKANNGIILESPVTIGATTVDYIAFTQGIIYTDQHPDAELLVSAHASVNGASDNSFVNGPVKKEGNTDFIFPVGKDQTYMPIEISGAETGLNTVYTAEFFFDRHDGNVLDPLKYINPCEYWSLTKDEDGDGNDDDDIPVFVHLSWTNQSCEIPVDITELQVASYTPSGWDGIGNLIHKGSKLAGGVITSAEKADDYKFFTLSSVKEPGQGATVGLSLNNYGTKIHITNGTHILVNGNIMNEKSGDENDQGEIYNEGKIRLSKDWTNNANNFVFNTQGGQVEMFGPYQRIRGSNETRFENIATQENGVKEMYQDVEVINLLDIDDSYVNTREQTLKVTNPDYDAVTRNYGFVGSHENGFFARVVDPNLDEIYQFPVGAKEKKLNLYRPVNIIPNENTSGQHTYYIRLVPRDATYAGYDREKRGPKVEEINPLYHYIIQKDDGTPNVDDPVKVEFYFNPDIDGHYQGIGYWDDQPIDFSGLVEYDIDPPVLPAEFWKKADGLSAGEIPGQELTKKIVVNDWSDFDLQAFAFIKGAFIINTKHFGQPVNLSPVPEGVNYTITGDFPVTQPPYSTGTDGVGEKIAPEDLHSVQTMTVQGNDYSIPAQIKITTNANGDIVPHPDEDLRNEGYYEVYVVDDNTGDEHLLSKDLYAVVNRGIFILLSEPANAGKACKGQVKVAFSIADPLVYKISASHEFSITGVTLDKVIDMEITCLSNTGVSPITITNTELFGTDPLRQISTPGLYSFTLTINSDNNEPINFEGQFIVIE